MQACTLRSLKFGNDIRAYGSGPIHEEPTFVNVCIKCRRNLAPNDAILPFRLGDAPCPTNAANGPVLAVYTSILPIIREKPCFI